MGHKRLVYEPYNKDQIKQILNSRIEGLNIISGNALDLVASKVSAYSGDIRRSLQITNRGIELCREEHLKSYDTLEGELTKVTARHFLAAFEELYQSKTVQVLKSLRKMEVLILIALFLEKKATKMERILLYKL